MVKVSRITRIASSTSRQSDLFKKRIASASSCPQEISSTDVRSQSACTLARTFTPTHSKIHNPSAVKRNKSSRSADIKNLPSLTNTSKIQLFEADRSRENGRENRQRHRKFAWWKICCCCCLLCALLLGIILASVITAVIGKNPAMTSETTTTTSTSTTTSVTTVSTTTTTTSTTTSTTTTSTTTTITSTTTSTTTTSTTTTTTSTTSTSVSTVTIISRLNQNLLINGDAETGPCELHSSVTHPSVWDYNGSVTQTYYNNTAFGSVTSTSPGPNDRGNCFFFGQSSASTSMWQTVNLTDAIDLNLIDNQTIRFNLSAWLGGWQNQDDNAKVTLQFYDQNNQLTGSSTTIGPVLAADRGSVTKLLPRQANGYVPIGSRSLKVTVIFTCISPTDNDGIADSIAVALFI